DGIFEELQLREVHPLYGHRGFGFLLTGTLTTLEDGRAMSVTGGEDSIVRGTFDLLGDNSDLTVQSDKWIYWEGTANVTGNLGLPGGVNPAGVGTGANPDGLSLWIDPTSSLITKGAGTDITIRGGQDVVVGGLVLAGGEVTTADVAWAGPDSTVTI